jgi:hypothetical protein
LLLSIPTASLLAVEDDMLRGFCVALALLGLFPSVALAQSYQHSSDGLVVIHVKKVVEADRSIGFDVCAQLVRQEQVGPLEVRLNFWGTPGGMLAQTSSILRPEPSAPVCQRALLPARARNYGRWEISRFRFQPAPLPQTAVRPLQRG